jgi:hypothetical protein
MEPSTALRSETNRHSPSSTTRRTCPTCTLAFPTERTTGVRLSDGTVVACKRVVSSVGYHNTFGKLVPEQVTERLEIPRRLPIGSSCGFVMANIGLRGTAEELGLTCANLWYHPTRKDGDMFGAINDFMAAPTDPECDPMIMVTFPSIKDRKGQDTVTCGQPIVQGAGLITAFRILGLPQSLRYLGRTLPPILRSFSRARAQTAPS